MTKHGIQCMDLTTGNMYSLLLRFTLPIIAGQLFQNLYNSVDAIVVGRMVSHTALAAVTSCGDISMLLTGFFSGFSVGAGVVFSKYYGARDDKRLRAAIHTAMLFALLLGAAMVMLGIMFTPQLLRMIDCPTDVFPEALDYLRVYLIGIFFTSLYNVGAGVLRAVGNSKAPLEYLIAAGCVNIVLDIVFVAGLRLGTMGTALATILSQAFSVALVGCNMLRTKEVYAFRLAELCIDRRLLWEIVCMGMPAAIQTSLIALSNLFVQRYINHFGSTAMAGIGAAKKIDRLVGMTAQSAGLACTTFVSQNLGAGKYERVEEAIRKSVFLGVAASVAVGTPIYLCAPQFAALFTDNAQAAAYAVRMMQVIVPTYAGLAIDQTLSNAIRGYGRSVVAMTLSMFGLIGCRQVFLFVTMRLSPCVENIYWAYPVGWTSSMLVLSIYYFARLRRKACCRKRI